MSDFLAYGRQVLSSQPFSVDVGTELLSFSEGRVELRLSVQPRLLQQHGFVHGGVVSYLADNALTFAGGSRLSGRIVTSEMKINYIRPATGEALIARAECLHAGRTQAIVRCEIFAVRDGQEYLCAAAQGTIVGTSEGVV